jgi:hypothetical protein
MADEKSKLVETVEQETQETETKETKTKEASSVNTIPDEFNPLAFTNDVPLEVDESKTQKNEKEINDNSEEVIEEDDDSFKWEEIETDTKEESKEEEVDWDSVDSKTGISENEESSSGQDSELDWGKIGKELGINANSKEDIATALNSKNPGINTESIIQFQKFLSMEDRQLLGEEMKADGMKHDDVEETLDKMEDSGMMKREAHRIRKQLQQAINYEKSSSSEMSQKEQQERTANASNAKKELQTHLKKMDRFMGGKITKDQARKAYSYITSGKMSEDIWKSHDNASEIAMFMLFKDKFMKILRAQGLEDGKASVFNKITSPSLGRNSKPSYKVKKDGFDPGAFMKE